MSVVVFSSTYFNIGAMYTVSSRYEHTFIGKCVECDGEKVVFETPYGKLSVTPSMTVSDDYKFEKININPQQTGSLKMEKSLKNNFEQIIVNAYREGLKDPLGPLLAYHGAVAGDGKEVNYESKLTPHDIGRCGTHE